MWKGLLSFGLVNVPVTMVKATRSKTISFNQLRKSDYSRIQYKKVASDGAEVPATEICKGYKLSEDRYVVISDADLEAISPKASRIIEISDFVKLEEIDTRFYDNSYYLVPDQGASKAYALLLRSMSEANVVGIAKFVLRNKEYLAAIRPTDNVITLSTMLFADEIVQTKEIENDLPSNVELSDKELKMAQTLINSLITKFEPEKYENEYHKQVMAMIENKAENEMTVSTPVDTSPYFVDLMSALEASMASIKKNESKKKAPRKPKSKSA
ncbi:MULTISPECIES: Ku protein [Pelosinus]|uniref:Non-homologous end joining protein Ku n=1 Tax=Pelosinus fermentans B4 TaxID=1149862 RepID=I9LJJ3_9FIRM|nr:Ku protein [Pelosinus fermentans B4]EIW25456.1 DNA repair protein [Pelosinus fermentans A11]OAM91975.1 DNA repair protein [Pelosinus fermentans DSM 17108]SDQ03048.1 DNA end-binding protein Ku [Pelosinus fermentans]OAM93716.1 DNA repair protein [Pelosinus fermentans DSM 17108]